MRPHASPSRHPLVLPLAAAYAAALFAWVFLRHRHFGSPAFELGAYHSVLWNVAFRGTPWNSLERVHQWSTHFEIGLGVLVPLYRIAASPVWLWLAESLCCAAAALPIDALARRASGDAVVGLCAAAATLLAPAMVLGQLADFHTLALCALPVAVMAWAIEIDAPRALVLGGALAMLLREQMGIVVALAAAVWVVRHGKQRAPAAIALAVLALGISALEIFVIIPAFGSGQSLHYVANYGSLGAGADEALRTATHRPLGVAATLLDLGRARYVAELAGAAAPLTVVAFASLRRTAWPLVIALPQLVIQLLSSSWHKWDIHFPYGMPLVPLVAATAVMALGRVPIDKWPNARRAVAAGWVALTVVHLATRLPSPVGAGRPIDPAFAASERAAALAQAIAAVPAEASICAQDDVVPHVATRSEIHRFPDGRATDDFILLDVDGSAPNVRSTTAVSAAARALRVSPAFEIVVDRGGVLLAKRVSPRSVPGGSIAP